MARKSFKKVAILGPRGTHTERAARYWGQRAKLKYVRVSDIRSIFEHVSKKKATYGVIPIEDSVEGDITLSFDLLKDYDLYIVGEIQAFVTHCLLAKKGKEAIKTIASHPQALAHCRRYIEMNFPKVALRQTGSTAEAARLASTDPTIGAIANESVANIYGLNVISRDTHDYGNNTTRFLVLAREQVRPKGPAKTSILVDPPEDRPGVLYQLLRGFADRMLNLTKIVSRPMRGILGEYTFYIDFLGNQEDQKVKEAFNDIEKEAAIRNFGSYKMKIMPKPILKKAKSQVTMDELRLMEPSLRFWESEEDKIYDSM